MSALYQRGQVSCEHLQLCRDDTPGGDDEVKLVVNNILQVSASCSKVLQHKVVDTDQSDVMHLSLK